MNIYIDFDDCLCETARHFSDMVEKMFGKIVPYEEVKCFNLQASYSLTDEQYEKMMLEGHTRESLLELEETPGASETINKWIDEGHEVSIITGRPNVAYEASREWLDQHGLERVKLYCLNKYGRDNFIKNSEFNLELEDYYKMHFDYAIEDSPLAFKFFDHLPDLKVLVFDRPWNHETELPKEGYTRCDGWETIKNIVK
ncbi:MAG: 2-dehydropantoate 2-reductase [Butyrivibrio sp.]|nr:2-dehydropantoate 2-reductase [Butyrivibrio sp.]